MALNVLVFGDSLTKGPYGQFLESAIKMDGHNVTRCAVGGFAAYQFIKGVTPRPDFATSIKYNQIKNNNFDIVIMSMGTNDAAGMAAYAGEPGMSPVGTVSNLLIQLANSFTNAKKIYWVGPPAFSEYASRHNLGSNPTNNPRYRTPLPSNSKIIMDLNYRSELLWNYLSPKFVSSLSGGKQGVILDPRNATRPYAPNGDIHFGAPGGVAWAKFTFKSVFGKDANPKAFKGIKADKAPVGKFQEPPPSTNTTPATTTTAATSNYNPNNTSPLNSGVVDKKKLQQLEKLCISDNEDITTPTLDNSTSIDGFLKHIIEKEHRESYLKGKKIFEGVVCRVPELYKETNYEVQSIISAQETAMKRRTYKVRVFDHDSPFIPTPKTFDGTEEDFAIISKLKDFEAPSDLVLRVGDCVLVTYGNLMDRTDGRIMSRLPESLQDKIQSAGGGSTSATASGAFNERQNIPVVVASAVAHESHANASAGGKDLGKIMVKDINVHGGKMQTLEEHAADRFIQMRDAAAKDKINIHLSSGFRSKEEQAALKERSDANGGYPPTNSGESSPIAGHRAGNAADIAVGSSYSSKEYLWLFKNAPNYDYYNSGRFVKSKGEDGIEPWHHQYAPPGSVALKSSGQTIQAVQYHREGKPYGGAPVDEKKAVSNP